MEIMILAIGLAILIFLLKGVLGIAIGKKMHCLTCGTEDTVALVKRGNVAIEIILWIFFIIPGLIYSLWRMDSRHNACRTCASTVLAPVKSPAAAQHRKTLGT